jgi:hypothetical protein
MEPGGSLLHSKVSTTYCFCWTKGSVQVLGLVKCFVNILSFYGEELLALRPTTKLEDHTLSPVRDCLFAYSIYPQLPFILEAIPPSATWGRAMFMMTGSHISWRHHSYANISRTTSSRHLTGFPGGLPSWKWLCGKTTFLRCPLLTVWRHRWFTLACQVVRSAVERYCFMRDMLLPVASVKFAEGYFSCLVGSVLFMSAQFQFLNRRI